MELPGLMAVLDCRVESISQYVIQQTFRDASKCITELEADNKRLREGFEKLKRRFEEVDIDPYEDWDTGSFGEIIDAALEPPKGE